MRLDLDWSLNTTEERKEFADRYVQEHANELTSANLNTIAEYVLWAEAEQHRELGYVIETEKSPWRTSKKEVSIEELFSRAEETGRPVDLLLQQEKVQAMPKKRLEREEVARRLGADSLERLYNMALTGELIQLHGTASQWIDLWTQIDKVEYMVQFWELERGKRKTDKPIRKELKEERLGYVALLSGMIREDLIALLEVEANKLEPYTYLRAKRLLVSLRQQQYQLLDALPSQGRFFNKVVEGGPRELSIIGFFPIEDVQLKLGSIEERYFEPDFQDRVVKALRRMDSSKDIGKALYPDLREEKTIRVLLERREEVEERIGEMELEEQETMKALFKYLDYYIMRADLAPELKVVMEMKANKSTNREVSDVLKERFNLSYMENYISTIYTRRIIQAIVREVNAHVRMLEYITMGKNVFKTCADCRELLPRNADFFNRRKSMSDGFVSHCKTCGAKRREQKRRIEEEQGNGEE